MHLKFRGGSGLSGVSGGATLYELWRFKNDGLSGSENGGIISYAACHGTTF
jgi:hypothetical protein